MGTFDSSQAAYVSGGGGSNSGTPGGNANDIQFNNAGALGGDDSLKFVVGTGVTLQNQTASALDSNQNSPSVVVGGTYYGAPDQTLAASNVDTYSIQNVLSNGAQISGSTQITQVSESSGSVVTLTLASPATVPAQGQTWVITGLSAATWLNGYAVKLITGSSTSCTFNDPTSHGTLTTTALTGTPIMTKVSGMSALVFNHVGSPNDLGFYGTNLFGGNSVQFPGAATLMVGTPSNAGQTAGASIALASAYDSNYLILQNYTSGNLTMRAMTSAGVPTGGAIGIVGAGGLNLTGSTGATLSLSNGSTWTTGNGGTITGSPTSNVYTLYVLASFAASPTQSQSAQISIQGHYWNGSASATDTWAIEGLLSNGTNAASTLTIGHSGTSGLATIQLNNHIGSTNGDVVGTVSSASGTTVSVTFATSYSSTPVVVVTPTTNCGAFYLSAVSTSGFTITYGSSGAQTFNYFVMGASS